MEKERRKNICVYCGASPLADKSYLDAAHELGRLIAENGYGLVYGGGSEGMMGAVARGADEAGGYITGVMPIFLDKVDGVAYEGMDEKIVTRDIRDRKELMDINSDYFVALPGGAGTFDELLEILGLRQLCNHDRAIVVLNTNNYFENFIEMMDMSIREKFAKPSSLTLIQFVRTPQEVIDYIKSYKPAEIPVDELRFFKTGGDYEGDDNGARRG